MRGKRATNRIDGVQGWHERNLTQGPVKNEELEVVEEEGEDLTQGVLNLGTVHEPSEEENGVRCGAPEGGERSKERVIPA